MILSHGLWRWLWRLVPLGCVIFAAGCGDYVFIGPPAPSSKDEADFIMEGLRMTITRSGKPLQELRADNAILKASQGRIELNDVTVLLFDENQSVEGTLVADRGVVFITDSLERRKNDFDLLDDVKYHAEDGAFFNTDEVHFYNETDTIESATPVHQGRQMGSSLVELRGAGFQSDRRFRQITTFGATLSISPAEETNQR